MCGAPLGNHCVPVSSKSTPCLRHRWNITLTPVVIKLSVPDQLLIDALSAYIWSFTDEKPAWERPLAFNSAGIVTVSAKHHPMANSITPFRNKCIL